MIKELAAWDLRNFAQLFILMISELVSFYGKIFASLPLLTVLASVESQLIGLCGSFKPVYDQECNGWHYAVVLVFSKGKDLTIKFKAQWLIFSWLLLRITHIYGVWRVREAKVDERVVDQVLPAISFALRNLIHERNFTEEISKINFINLPWNTWLTIQDLDVFYWLYDKYAQNVSFLPNRETFFPIFLPTKHSHCFFTFNLVIKERCKAIIFFRTQLSALWLWSHFSKVQFDTDIVAENETISLCGC